VIIPSAATGSARRRANRKAMMGPMTVIASVRAGFLARAIARAEREQELPGTTEGRREAQVALLNAEWARARETSPRAARLAREHRLPHRFGTIEEYARRMPPLTKREIQDGAVELRSRGRRPDFYRMTGGSTAAPVRIPAWSSEIRHTNPWAWLGRRRYGITPASRLFLLWGHSHLLGSGWPARVRAMRRALSDRALGYLRFSAYNLAPEALSAGGEALLAFRPDYVVGYSVALDQFARANEHRRAGFRALGLRAVIGTAESFPFPDTGERLADLFGAPVAMEYGAVETAVLAHTVPAGMFEVYWRQHLLEALRGPAGWRLVVTSLFPRCTPLLRYEIGDLVEPGRALGSAGPDHLVGLAQIERVVGRTNAFVRVGEALIHSEAFTHAVRGVAGIRAYQVLQEGPRIEVRYLGDEPLAQQAVEGIRERLGRVHPGLAAIPVLRVDALERTVAGKSPMVIIRQAG